MFWKFLKNVHFFRFFWPKNRKSIDFCAKKPAFLNQNFSKKLRPNFFLKKIQNKRWLFGANSEKTALKKSSFFRHFLKNINNKQLGILRYFSDFSRFYFSKKLHTNKITCIFWPFFFVFRVVSNFGKKYHQFFNKNF